MRARALLLIVALPFAACGDDDAGPPASTAAPPVAAERVAIEGFLFRSDAIEVTAGTTVTWTNADDFAHTVTADDASFDSGDIAGGGGTFEQTFDEPGTYSYFCNIHNYMRGAITVA